MHGTTNVKFVNYVPLSIISISIPLTTSSHFFEISLYFFCSSQLLIWARFINIRDGVCYHVFWHLVFWQAFVSVFREPAVCFCKKVILNRAVMQTSNVIQKKYWSQRVLRFIFILFWMFVLIKSLKFVSIYIFLILRKIMSHQSLFLDRKITQWRIEFWEGRPRIYLI
jgi:hypothetical protein